MGKTPLLSLGLSVAILTAAGCTPRYQCLNGSCPTGNTNPYVSSGQTRTPPPLAGASASPASASTGNPYGTYGTPAKAAPGTGSTGVKPVGGFTQYPTVNDVAPAPRTTSGIPTTSNIAPGDTPLPSGGMASPPNLNRSATVPVSTTQERSAPMTLPADPMPTPVKTTAGPLPEPKIVVKDVVPSGPGLPPLDSKLRELPPPLPPPTGDKGSNGLPPLSGGDPGANLSEGASLPVPAVPRPAPMQSPSLTPSIPTPPPVTVKPLN